jgi:hypothetical protein
MTLFLGGRTGWMNPLALMPALVNYVRIHKHMFGRYGNMVVTFSNGG